MLIMVWKERHYISLSTFCFLADLIHEPEADDVIHDMCLWMETIVRQMSSNVLTDGKTVEVAPKQIGSGMVTGLIPASLVSLLPLLSGGASAPSDQMFDCKWPGCSKSTFGSVRRVPFLTLVLQVIAMSPICVSTCACATCVRRLFACLAAARATTTPTTCATTKTCATPAKCP